MPNFSGKWNLAGQLQGIKQGTWPGFIVSAELYSWGQNNDGQLGHNDQGVNRSSPIQVGSEEKAWQVRSLSGSISLYAVKTDGTLWAAGDNGNGRLGLNDEINRSSPVQVGSETHWSKVSQGNNGGTWTLALTTDGKLYAWGRNDYGNLGDGTVVYRSSPVQIGSDTDWSDIAAGAYGSVAVKTDGTIWSWGREFRGTLGHNDNDLIHRSSPTQIGALTNWSSVGSGGFVVHAIKTDGTLWGWGGSTTGSIGDNTIIRRSSPVQIGSDTDWLSVISGENQAVGVKTTGYIYSWGSGFNGELGHNDTISKSSPTQIGLLNNWSKGICGGNGYMAGLKNNGTLWTWGSAGNGVLGQNDAINKSSPVQVGSLQTWSDATMTRYGMIAAVLDVVGG
jgi:alpha-tubulin suppressor-like RCC1 family protein